MKRFIVSAVIILATGSLLVLVQRPVAFLSLESKTVLDTDVFNRIKFIPGWDRDTWIMQQSHHGPTPSPHLWDRLAIVVDKTKRPFRASFYQFSPGELTMGAINETVPFKAPCYACHANGPRAIRPKNSDLLQKIQVSMLNIRIKSYLQVDSISGQPHQQDHPFQRQHAAFKASLQLPSCVLCHGEGKLRNELKRDHLDTAQFLVENKQMPPWPFSISQEDEEKLKQWGL